jgi:hypothetical protein
MTLAGEVAWTMYGRRLPNPRSSSKCDLKGFLADATIPEQLPSWLTDEDTTYFVETYKRSGYRGGLNWYRNIDRNWGTLSGLGEDED